MKVNFWQILGVVLIVLAVVFFRPKKTGKDDTVKPPATNPIATQPAP